MVVRHGSLCSPLAGSASRKRQHLSAGEQQPTDDGDDHDHDHDAAHSLSKKRKLAHPSCCPPQFWDGLSKIFLTTNALRELDRRNSQRRRTTPESLQPPIQRRSRRLRTSPISAERGDSLQQVDQVLGQYSATCLKWLKRSATHGGPDLSDLRGVRLLPLVGNLADSVQFHRSSSIPGFDMSSASLSSLGRRKRGSRSPEKSSATPNTTKTRSTGPYDRDFQQHLVDHGIYPDMYIYPDGRAPSPPINMDDIRNALAQRRPSLSPSQMSDGKFTDFRRADASTSKESQVIIDVIPLIEGTVEDRRCVARQTPFTNLDHLTDGTLVAATPDLCYGARPEQLDRRVREALSGQVVPSTQADLPVAPNYFVEVKGPDGSSAVAQRQIVYDMALGERGQAALLDVGGPQPVYDQHAHTLGYTYQNGTVRMYAMHMIEPSTGPRPEFVTTQVDSYSLTGNPRSFREGIKACRNGRDWAKRQRDQAIAKANERAAALGIHGSSRRDGLPLLSEESAAETEDPASQATITDRRSNAASKYDSDTSADELSADFRPDKRAKGRENPRSTTARQS